MMKRGNDASLPRFTYQEVHRVSMTKNLMSGIFALLLGVAYLIGAALLPDVNAGDEIGPRLFPYIIGTATILCGGVLVFKDLRAKERPAFSFKFQEDHAVWTKIAICVVLGVFYGKALDFLGYVISTFIFMLCCSTLINLGRTKQNIIISTLFSLVTYVVFAIGLELSLPRGLLDFLPF